MRNELALLSAHCPILLEVESSLTPRQTVPILKQILLRGIQLTHVLVQPYLGSTITGVLI
jgi:hypothetical protein